MDPHENEYCAAILGMQELYGAENRPHPAHTHRTAVGRKPAASERRSTGLEAHRTAARPPASNTVSLQDALRAVGAA